MEVIFAESFCNFHVDNCVCLDISIIIHFIEDKILHKFHYVGYCLEKCLLQPKLQIPKLEITWIINILNETDKN